MHLKRSARRLVPWALLLGLGLGFLTSTSRGRQPDPKKAPEPVVLDRTGAIVVPVGEVRILDLPEAPTKVSPSREDLLDFKFDEKDPRRVYLIGKAPGVTQLVVERKGLAPVVYRVVVEDPGRIETITVPVGKELAFDLSGILKDKEEPKEIVVGREDVLGVRYDKGRRRLVLTGKTAGRSPLTIVREGASALRYDVVVETDPLTQLRELLRRAVPTANVTVEAGPNNTVILSGYVTSPQEADIISRLISGPNVVNAIQVGGVQQVQIDVVIASVDRTQLRSRGFDFSVPGGSFSFASLVSGLLGAQGGIGLPTFSGDGNLQFAVVPNRFFGAMRALRTEGVAKFLAEPRVVTQTGRPAFFRAGGQQAILSPTSGITGPGVQLVPFGTQLEVVPIVYGNGMIWLDIAPTVTAVNAGLGITVNGANSPGFTEQTVRSTVLLESGQTFVIGGLIQHTVNASSTKVPVLGDLPFLGAGFSRVNYETRETELIIMVTPRLVHPLDNCQTPKRLPGQETRTPDDYELFLENILEAPRGQRKVWNGRCYNAPYKCDPTIGKYPCVGGVCVGPNGVCVPGAPAAAIGPGHAMPATPLTPPGGAGGPTNRPDAPAVLPPIPGVPVGGGTEGGLPPIPSPGGAP